MRKFLIVFGIITLFVTLPCASQSDESESEVDDVNDNYDDDFDDDDDIDEGSDSEEENDIFDENDNDKDIFDDNSYATKGKFVESDGIKKPCYTHDNCYDQREPPSWCKLDENQSWAESGCFCNRKENSCIIERRNRGKLEYTYCAPIANWKCS